MSQKSWQQSRRRTQALLALFLLALAIISLHATAPTWWSTRQAIDPALAPQADDYAAINQGQLKHLATQAYHEFQATLPGGAGPALTALIQSWQNPSPTIDDYAAINLGQLKTIAAPFYQRLHALGHRIDPATPSKVYPWTETTEDDDDYALANIGQAKHLFAFHIPAILTSIQGASASPANASTSTDTDGDGLPDAWENQYGLEADNPGTPNDPEHGANGDPDNDGLTNYTEYLLGLNPTIANDGSQSILTLTPGPSDTINLTFPSLLGRQYRIEYTHDLNAPWAPASPWIDGTGTLITWNDDGTTTGTPPSLTTRRFYRLTARLTDTSPSTGDPTNPSTTDATAPPAAPSNLTVTYQSATVTLTWQDNSHNEDAFHIRRSPKGQNQWTIVGQVPANTTTWSESMPSLNWSQSQRPTLQIGGFLPILLGQSTSGGTGYDYSVRSSNAAGTSPWSTAASTPGTGSSGTGSGDSGGSGGGGGGGNNNTGNNNPPPTEPKLMWSWKEVEVYTEITGENNECCYLTGRCDDPDTQSCGFNGSVPGRYYFHRNSSNQGDNDFYFTQSEAFLTTQGIKNAIRSNYPTYQEVSNQKILAIGEYEKRKRSFTLKDPSGHGNEPHCAYNEERGRYRTVKIKLDAEENVIMNIIEVHRKREGSLNGKSLFGGDQLYDHHPIYHPGEKDQTRKHYVWRIGGENFDENGKLSSGDPYDGQFKEDAGENDTPKWTIEEIKSTELKSNEEKEFTPKIEDPGFNKRRDWDVLVLPIEVKQLNYPNTKNSTDEGNLIKKTIYKDEIAYINGNPDMPRLVIKLKGADNIKDLSNETIEWRLEIETERSERKELDNVKYPKEGPKILKMNEEWNVYADFLNPDFVGGKAKLTYKIKNFTGEFTFKIRGKNPLDLMAKNYIQSVQGVHRYAWAIAQHESRQGTRVYNQFNAGGSRKELPNYGWPDGWGIFQIDRFREGKSTTTKETYDWNDNVRAGIDKLNKKMKDSIRIFGYFKNKWRGDSRWEEPPISYSYQGFNFSAIELATMVLYNGVSGCPQSQTINDSGKPWTVTFPWTFDPNRSPKWFFHDNLNPVSNKPYAKSVINDEWKGGSSITE